MGSNGPKKGSRIQKVIQPDVHNNFVYVALFQSYTYPHRCLYNMYNSLKCSIASITY